MASGWAMPHVESTSAGAAALKRKSLLAMFDRAGIKPSTRRRTRPTNPPRARGDSAAQLPRASTPPAWRCEVIQACANSLSSGRMYGSVW